MLDINTEFRKGILFIRLTGVLNEKTFHKLEKEVNELVKENRISKVVFNVNELISIDLKGIDSIYNNYKICKKNNGRCLLCNLKNSTVKNIIRNSKLSKYMFEASDELSAINVMNL